MEESIRLLEELNEYEIALSSEFISYLKRLLFLEVSALDNNYITDKDREVFKNIKIYKDIVYYNLITKVKDFLEEEKISYKKTSSGISVNMFNKELLSIIMRNNFNIYLNTYIHNEKYRCNIIDYINSQINYLSKCNFKDMKHINELYYYEEELNKIINRKQTDETKKEEVYSVIFADKLLDNINLSNFSEEKVFTGNTYKKVLKKEYPLIKIEKNINYL